MYLVTGGSFFNSDNFRDDYLVTYLDSTEVLVKDAFSWEILTKAPLPQPMTNLGKVSFQNKIFMIGKS